MGECCDDEPRPGEWDGLPPLSAPQRLDVAEVAAFRAMVREGTTAQRIHLALADYKTLSAASTTWRRHDGQGEPWGGVRVTTGRWSAVYVPLVTPTRDVAQSAKMVDLPF